jgi:hypothetical protein
MIKSIVSLLMVLSAIFVLSISAFAQEDNSTSVNPGSEPETGSGKSLVEGGTDSIGVYKYCPTCPNHKKYIRLGDNTNQSNDYTALLPSNSSGKPAKTDDLAK